MSTSGNSATGYYRKFGMGPDNQDMPPSGTEEEMIVRISSATRLAASENAIKNHVLIAFSLGLIPIPLFDFAMLVVNQIKMVHALGGIYGGQSFNDARLKAVILSLISGALPVLGVRGLSSGLKLMPGIGSLVGSGAIAVSGGLLTYAVGRVFVKHFESGGTYLNLDRDKARERLRKEMEKGRAFVSGLGKGARGTQPAAA